MEEHLYIKRIFAELNFLSTDIDIKKDLLNKYQMKFNNEIIEYLNDHPVLKKEYDNLLKQDEEEFIKNLEKEKTCDPKESDEDIDKSDEDYSDEEFEEDLNKAYLDNIEKRSFKEDKDIKRIYREIVKKTHPDRIGSDLFKEQYILATVAYEFQKLYDIIKIALSLNIEIGDLSEENLDKLEIELKDIKNNIKQIESNIVWQYYEKLDSPFKRKMLLQKYITSFIEEMRKF